MDFEKIEFTPQAVEALTNLAETLDKTLMVIAEETGNLRNVYMQNAEAAGPHSNEIGEIIGYISKLIEESSDVSGILAAKMLEKAEFMMQIIAARLKK